MSELARRGCQAFGARLAGLLHENVQARGQRIDPGRLPLQNADLLLLRNDLLL